MKITLEHHGLKPIKIPEGPGEFNIGWEEGNDFIMTPRIPGISRTHFIIIQEGRCNIFLVDNSKNGTFLNGTEVSSGAKNRVKLKDGDTIRLGGREEGEMPLAEFTVRIES
jgi:pSer/pThr/pTyr-binding forkhead associated (FHA) protein